MKKYNKHKRLVFELTTSGITAGVVLIMLALAQYSPVGKLSFFVLAGIALLLPCVIESLWALIMAFLAGGALAVLFNPVNVIPFVCFFGPQVILMYLSKRYLNNKPYVSIPLKLALLEVGIFGVYSIYGISYIERIFEYFDWTYNYWFVMLLTLPVILVYDYGMQLITRFIARRLNGVICKYTDKVKKINKPQTNRSEPSEGNLNGNGGDSTPNDDSDNDLFD